MAKRINPEAGKVQFVWESILKWVTFALGCLHLLLSLLRYYDPAIRTNLLKVEKWAAIILLLGMIAYVLYTKIREPRLMFRIGNFTKGLFRPELKMLTVFYLWYLICVISANEAYTANLWQLNDNYLFDCFMSFFSLFILGYLFRENAGKKMLEIFFYVLTIVMTAAMIYVLIVVCKPAIITLPSGGQIGMNTEVRLYANCHPNTVGAIAEILIMLCLYFALAKKGVLRWLFASASVVHYFILILSDSRTCMVTTALTIGILAFKTCFDVLNGRKSWQRIALAAVAGIIFGGIVLGLRRPVRLGYEQISHFSEYLNKDVVIRDIEATTNMRTLWWKATVQSVFSDVRHFFFGVTPAGVISEINRLTGYQMYTHNQFCEIMLSSGIPGVLMYLGWLVMVAVTCVKVLIGKVRKGTYKGIEVILGTIFMLVIANLMEATLLYYHWFPEEIFFLLCGFVTYRYGGEKGKKLS